MFNANPSSSSGMGVINRRTHGASSGGASGGGGGITSTSNLQRRPLKPLQRRGTYSKPLPKPLSKPLHACDGGSGGLNSSGLSQEALSGFQQDDDSDDDNDAEFDDYNDTYHDLKSCRSMDSKDSFEKQRRHQLRKGTATAYPELKSGIEIPNGSSHANDLPTSLSKRRIKYFHRKTVLTVSIAVVALLCSLFAGIYYLLSKFDGEVVIGGTTVKIHHGSSSVDRLNEIEDAPRISKVSQEMIDKLNEDSRLHEHELQALKDQLQQVQKQESELENELQQQQQQKSKQNKLRGNENQQQQQQENKEDNYDNNNSPRRDNNDNNSEQKNNAPPPDPEERQIHLLNRSERKIRVFWVTDHVTDRERQQVEWILLTGQDSIQSNSTFHFHARPHHKFAIRCYDDNNDYHDETWEDLFYEVPEPDGDKSDDPFVVVTKKWELDSRFVVYGRSRLADEKS